MRVSLICLLVVTLLLPGCSPEQGRVVMADVNLGRVAPDSITNVDVTIQNQGNGPASIKRIVPGCGCLDVKTPDTLSLGPQQSQVLSFALHAPSAHGRRVVKVAVETAGNKTAAATCNIHYEVYASLNLSPAILNFSPDLGGGPNTQKLVAKIKVNDPAVNIQHVSVANVPAALTAEVIKEESGFGVAVSLKPNVDIYGELFFPVDVLVDLGTSQSLLPLVVGGRSSASSQVTTAPSFMALNARSARDKSASCRISGIPLEGGAVGMAHNSQAFQTCVGAELQAEGVIAVRLCKALNGVPVNGSLLLQSPANQSTFISIPVYCLP